MWQLFPEKWELSALNTKLQKALHIFHNWQGTLILPFDIMQSVHFNMAVFNILWNL